MSKFVGPSTSQLEDALRTAISMLSETMPLEEILEELDLSMEDYYELHGVACL